MASGKVTMTRRMRLWLAKVLRVQALVDAPMIRTAELRGAADPCRYIGHYYTSFGNYVSPWSECRRCGLKVRYDLRNDNK